MKLCATIYFCVDASNYLVYISIESRSDNVSNYLSRKILFVSSLQLPGQMPSSVTHVDSRQLKLAPDSLVAYFDYGFGVLMLLVQVHSLLHVISKPRQHLVVHHMRWFIRSTMSLCREKAKRMEQIRKTTAGWENCLSSWYSSTVFPDVEFKMCRRDWFMIVDRVHVRVETLKKSIATELWRTSSEKQYTTI